MQKTILLAAIMIIIIIIINSCNNNNSVTNNNNNNGNCVTSLSGQFVNWTHTGKFLLYLAVYDSTRTNRYVVDTGIISSNGSFSLNLNTPPSGGLINPTTDTTCHPRITYTQGTKIAIANFEIYDSTNHYIGSMLRSNYDTTGYVSGEFVVGYIYSNTAYSFSGTSICTDLHDTIDISVSGQVCWNRIVILYEDVYGGVPTRLSETNNEPNNSGKWYFIGVPEPNKPADGMYNRYYKNMRSPWDL